MKIASMPQVFAGVFLGFSLLVFVNKFELFGSVCYYVGPLSLNQFCMAPWIYYAAWLIAVGLVGFGVFGPLVDASAAKKPEQPLDM